MVNRIIHCDTCGKEVLKPERYIECSKSGKLFCSYSCAAQWRNRTVLKGIKKPGLSEYFKSEYFRRNNPMKNPEVIAKIVSKRRANGSYKMAPKGKKHYNWKGGLSFEPYTTDWTETLRRSIRERDNYICQPCSQYGDNVHHIDYDKKNCNPENLITLCRGCNIKVNYKRKYWINYFRSKKNGR